MQHAILYYDIVLHYDTVLYTAQYCAKLDACPFQIQAHPIVMFTKSGCSLSRKARELMNDNYPNVDYHYYEYDTQPLGDYFMYPSILTSGTLKTPQIYMCDRFIGGNAYLTENSWWRTQFLHLVLGTSSLRAIHDNNQLLSTVQSCTKRK